MSAEIHQPEQRRFDFVDQDLPKPAEGKMKGMEHDPITSSVVQSAIDDFEASLKGVPVAIVEGKVAIHPSVYKQSGQIIFCRYEQLAEESGLVPCALPEDEQAVCQRYLAELRPTESALDQTRVEDEPDYDKPLGTYNGVPLHSSADHYDPELGGYR